MIAILDRDPEPKILPPSARDVSPDVLIWSPRRLKQYTLLNSRARHSRIPSAAFPSMSNPLLTKQIIPLSLILLLAHRNARMYELYKLDLFVAVERSAYESRIKLSRKEYFAPPALSSFALSCAPAYGGVPDDDGDVRLFCRAARLLFSGKIFVERPFVFRELERVREHDASNGVYSPPVRPW